MKYRYDGKRKGYDKSGIFVLETETCVCDVEKSIGRGRSMAELTTQHSEEHLRRANGRRMATSCPFPVSDGNQIGERRGF